jgi:hypothetical protein
MTPTVSIRKALSEPKLLGGVLDGDSWHCWRVLLTASIGEPLTDDERDTFTKLTGRHHEPGQRVEELCAIAGRRGGKSKAMATLAAYIAGLCTHPLTRGEKGVLLCIAPDMKQAGIVLSYTVAAFEQSPILRQLIGNQTSDTLELTNGISIEVRAASFRRLRGPTYICVIADEAAFWHSDESANPDTEILAACRPGLATTNGMLVIASSPYARRGVLWQAHKQHYGPDGDKLILVAQGESRLFNPSLPKRVVERAYERDPASAAAEYGAEFRRDIESFVDLAAVEACVAVGVYERPPLSNLSYCAFLDPSGGSADSMTLAIGHEQDDVAILDAVREVRPPFSPEDVVSEFAALLKSYRIAHVTGDRYAGEWPRERFDVHDVKYEAAARPKSDLYRDLLPAINSRKVDLLDHPKLVAQLCSLERRTARGGRDSIDHAPGGHDDVVNCVAGLVNALAIGAGAFDSSLSWVGGPGIDDDKSDWIAPPPQVNARRPRIWQPGTGWHEAADSRDANVASDSAPPSWAARRSLWDCYPMFGANMHWSYRGRHR